jgi:multidrug efflux pump subunit AcrA (membrane-fusion protein)
MQGTAEVGSSSRFIANEPGLAHSHTPRAGLTRPAQLSPQSSSDSLVSSDSQASSAQSSAQASDASYERRQSGQRSPSPAPLAGPARTVSYLAATFIIEELSDFDGSDADRRGVIKPYLIEDAESERSRSRSRNPPEIDRTILYSLGKLRCSDDEVENSDQSEMDEEEQLALMARVRRARRQKRLSTGSIGKRTITESLGSDSDREDLRGTTTFLDITEVGSSARRLRRRVGDRRSLQFQDPPLPVIEQMEEPGTSDDELAGGEALARELPYYDSEYIIMEIDSP